MMAATTGVVLDIEPLVEALPADAVAGLHLDGHRGQPLARGHHASPAIDGRNRELAKYAKLLARREGLEPPTLRFEA